MARATGQGIEVLAITDHDTTDGLPEALDEAQKRHIRVVSGVEISTLSKREEIHLLGYFVDLDNPELQDLLTRTRKARWERAQKMLARLEELGLPVQWERLLELSGGGGSIGRPHVAMSLLDAGHVTTWEEAFQRWI
ncbi:MAG: PHP domain-containing protein, partial [Anaerolineae bacterium]